MEELDILELCLETLTPILDGVFLVARVISFLKTLCKLSNAKRPGKENFRTHKQQTAPKRESKKQEAKVVLCKK